jgi:hypothetical protein
MALGPYKYLSQISSRLIFESSKNWIKNGTKSNPFCMEGPNVLDAMAFFSESIADMEGLKQGSMHINIYYFFKIF